MTITSCCRRSLCTTWTRLPPPLHRRRTAATNSGARSKSCNALKEKVVEMCTRPALSLGGGTATPAEHPLSTLSCSSTSCVIRAASYSLLKFQFCNKQKSFFHFCRPLFEHQCLFKCTLMSSQRKSPCQTRATGLMCSPLTTTLSQPEVGVLHRSTTLLWPSDYKLIERTHLKRCARPSL
jgi:hypothetical protein